MENTANVKQYATEGSIPMPEAEPDQQKLPYKDKLTNVQKTPEEWKDWPDEEGYEDLLPKIDHLADAPSRWYKGPNVTFSREEKLELWKPWRKAVIVKPLHKSIGYPVLCNRAKSMWRLKGEFQAVDIGHSCSIFRFSEKEDYKRVLTEGPWNIGGYCFIVCQWTPYFQPDKDVVECVIT